MGEPFIDVDDIADAAVVALLEDGHAGELYELTGPRLLTFEEAIARDRAGERARRALRAVPMEEYTAALASSGCRRTRSRCSPYLFGEVLDGRNASVTDGVRQILGREPRELAATCRRRGMSTAVAALAIVTAVGAACTGGALYAFSSFVMPALERLPRDAGRSRRCSR